ncbi:MAG: DUF4388 domain-containing protein [candidate division Zixibacteria bacterium]|nr:DUF4388 domain-containing protein [candidate division Zixibacteria bacterium]
MAARKRLDQILLTKGLVSETKIRAALNRQRMHGGKLGEHLLRAGDIREIELVGALSEQFGVPGVCLTGRELDPALFEYLPRRLAESYHCVPLSYDRATNTMDVAFAEPANADAVWAVSQAVDPARVNKFVAAESAIHAVLTQSLLPASLPAETADSGRLSPLRAEPIPRPVITLLEMAVGAAERNRKSRSIDSIWTARLAEEMAVRLGLSNKTAQVVRLTALTAFCAAWQRPIPDEPASTLLERSHSLTAALDLPSDLADLLNESVRWSDASAPSPAAQVLRTAFAVGEAKPYTVTDAAVDDWQSKVASSVKWNLSPEFVALAFAIVREWRQSQQLDNPPREAMIVGTTPLADELEKRVSTAEHRCLKLATVAEALGLIRRRTPDLVCVHVAAETGSTYDELTDIFGAAPRHSTHVMLLIGDGVSVRVTGLARSGLAEVIAESDGADAIFARMEHVLSPPRMGAATDKQATSAAAKPAGFPSVAGQLAEMSLADLVQVLSASQKTAKVIFSRLGSKAVLWFQQGQIVTAQSGKLSGESAFFDLVKWHDGTFEVHTTDDVPARNVLAPTAALLLEGYRRLDEWRRDRDLVNTP